MHPPALPLPSNDYQFPASTTASTAVIGDGDRIYLTFRTPYTLVITDLTGAPVCGASEVLWEGVAEWVFQDRLEGGRG